MSNYKWKKAICGFPNQRFLACLTYHIYDIKMNVALYEFNILSRRSIKVMLCCQVVQAVKLQTLVGRILCS